MARKGRPISYKAYLKKRNEFKAKGYILDKPVSEKEYKELYKGASDLGKTNISYFLAKSDIAISRSRAKDIISLIKHPTPAQLASGLSAKAKALFGNKKNITQKDIMQIDLVSTGVTCPADKSKVAISNRQALFYSIWYELGNKEDTIGWFGY